MARARPLRRMPLRLDLHAAHPGVHHWPYDLRAPRTGSLLTLAVPSALTESRVDPDWFVLIGDTERDRQAAATDGIRAVRSAGGNLIECVHGAFA